MDFIKPAGVVFRCGGSLVETRGRTGRYQSFLGVNAATLKGAGKFILSLFNRSVEIDAALRVAFIAVHGDLSFRGIATVGKVSFPFSIREVETSFLYSMSLRSLRRSPILARPMFEA